MPEIVISKKKQRHPLSYYLLLLLGTAVLVAIDQFTKLLAVRFLKGKPGISVISGLFGLCYTENRGMAFSLLLDARTFFIIATVLMVGAMVFVYIRLPQDKKFAPLAAALIFIIGGALGNFIDRLRLGYVVDFIALELFDFPIFNVADIFITWTAVLAALLILFRYKDEDLKMIR